MNTAVGDLIVCDTICQLARALSMRLPVAASTVLQSLFQNFVNVDSSYHFSLSSNSPNDRKRSPSENETADAAVCINSMIHL